MIPAINEFSINRYGRKEAWDADFQRGVYTTSLEEMMPELKLEGWEEQIKQRLERMERDTR